MDCDNDLPKGYDVYVCFETKFHKKYYSPACAAKISKKLTRTSDSDSGKRKVQMFPFEIAPFSIEYFNYKQYDLHIRCIVRYSLCKNGPLNMPVYVARRLTKYMEISSCAHRDFAFLNAQRSISVFYSIVLNVFRGKLDVVTGEVNPKTSWKCKPAVLDASTQRNGMRNKDGELSIILVC